MVQRQAAVYQSQVVQLSTETVDADGSPLFTHENPQATVSE